MSTFVNLPFSFDFGVEVFEKAGEKNPRRIGGFVTTDKLDKQGERLLQDGLNFDPFLRDGWFNDNHSKETAGIVGHPESAELMEKGGQRGWWVEGHLLEGQKRADEIWETAKALQKSGRRLGFSVEGKITERAGDSGEIVARADIKNVAITNCFPGDVVVCGDVDKATRRHYSGPMVEIQLTSGEKLTGTPNHPVFTDRGWVALGKLDVGRDRVGRFDRDLAQATLPSVAHDVQDMPLPLEEVFDLAALSEACRWVRSIGEGQFHGDGQIDSDVDIVRTDGFLKDRLATAFRQHFGQQALVATDKKLSRLTGGGASFNLLVASQISAPRVVRRHSLEFSLGGGSSAVELDLGVTLVASDAPAFGDVEDGYSGDSVSGGDRGRTLSSAISFGNVTSKRVFDFSGHVYNLDTRHGWYSANGIVAHNCAVNTDTSMEVLAKSLGAANAELAKALSMGTGSVQHGGVGYNTPVTGGGAGQVLASQSLEGYEEPKPPKKKKRKKKRFTKSQGVAFLMERRGVSATIAERVYNLAQRKSARPARST
jgi:hypothetical protein